MQPLSSLAWTMHFAVCRSEWLCPLIYRHLDGPALPTCLRQPSCLAPPAVSEARRRWTVCLGNRPKWAKAFEPTCRPAVCRLRIGQATRPTVGCICQFIPDRTTEAWSGIMKRIRKRLASEENCF
ncbi:unnamed protein product [Protopolystoma xenopodis]|uniref:Uncharacterized protein n=1 Tax=Protopolystoma xenopodis TaxID=117903 RepID=A0A448XJT0_9PLAT|nr:unnamed protein product [Protopolystoma xenopodis]